MSKNLLEAAERITNELTEDERLQLIKDLLQRTRRARWTRLFQSIDRKLKGRRFTMAEINAEIAAVRRARRHARPR